MVGQMGHNVFGPGFEPLQRTKFVRNWSPYIDKHQLCFFLIFLLLLLLLLLFIFTIRSKFLKKCFWWKLLELYSVAPKCVVFYRRSFLFKNWKRMGKRTLTTVGATNRHHLGYYCTEHTITIASAKLKNF